MSPSVYTYLDYRQYLVDAYAALRADNPRLSYRGFARMAGSTCPNLLQLIRDRKLNVTPAALQAWAKALGLSRKERAYLETLVAFDHAATHTDKDRHLRRILRTREYSRVRRLQREQYELFSHWYMPVIRELVVSPEYPGDPAWIAKRTVPHVSIDRVRRGIERLEALGLISRDETGRRWVQNQQSVSTPSEVLSTAIANYHRQVISLAGESIGRFKAKERDVRAATVTLSPRSYKYVKQRLEAVWKEALALGKDEENTGRVYQMNTQLFPVSSNHTRKQ